MDSAKEIVTASAAETFSLGVELGRGAARGDVFALSGDLGAGKTVLAKGIARGMGIAEEITSPTFTLLEVYEHTLPLYHFDLYRIDDPRELDSLYFEEYWEGDGVSVIEWADRAAGRLPAGTVNITLRYEGDTARRITVEHPGH
ncbi:MAG: tRNA (adenosine(37)-N6)-threonylcarbamoyltransferase complex ATPase subunit type 1 TsaE [Spirochaetes bacterium]|nr:tRNA (adenosine(37)-N6)-threonylcarbamoyltransferase complex ATPase subunit type 1 TsaE [Spirochaetota bacterium]